MPPKLLKMKMMATPIVTLLIATFLSGCSESTQSTKEADIRSAAPATGAPIEAKIVEPAPSPEPIVSKQEDPEPIIAVIETPKPEPDLNLT